ncbi:leucine-rich repeat protein [Listeria sp. PSOL-1]|uniref:leucine-rich repeat protein n=1 Tax=Listeria sp. PSOL-1 TaxID=1844999 RepID=UPI0013D82A16|nr:leucine-rich repeat protein [Listeria sp. PSOL-1]
MFVRKILFAVISVFLFWTALVSFPLDSAADDKESNEDSPQVKAAKIIAKGGLNANQGGYDLDAGKWTLDSEGLLYISGMAFSRGNNDPVPYWSKMSQQIKTVVFDDKFVVGSLINSWYSFNNYFKNCSNLERVKFPTDLNIVYSEDFDSMFEGCSSLKEIELPIIKPRKARNMFKGCTSLKSVKFNNSLSSNKYNDKNWGGFFEGCDSLSKIEFPVTSTLVAGAMLPTPPNTLPYFGKWRINDEKKSYTPIEALQMIDNSKVRVVVTWAESMATLDVKDSVIPVNSVWNPVDNFVSATNHDGDPIYYNNSMLVERYVDTSTPGTYEVAYQHPDRADLKKIVKVEVVNPGFLDFKSVPSTMSFEDSVISNKLVEAKRKDPNWQLTISDTRVVRSNWRITAQLLTPLTNAKGETLNDALFFRKKGSADQLINTKDTTVIYEGIGNSTKELYDIQWGENAGPIMKIRPGSAKLGAYQANIEFALLNVPA